MDIHLYDSQGRHVGRNEQGGIDEEIPGAEYIEIPDLHEKTITVHGGDGLDGYRFVLTGTGTGAFDFTVTSADHAHNSSDTVKYISVPVTADTEASVTLDQQQDYTLVVDDDGDGTTDEQRRPDSVVTQAVDLTPPARVTDLAVTNTSSGTAELSFTAPGDDEDAGTARYYDIRYGTEPVTEDNWREAMPLETVPLPQAAGSVETAVATGLSAGTTYYFALKARDETLQSSVLSNLAAGTTTIPELAWSIQGVYWASLNDYCVRQLSIEYRLGNAGTGAAPGATVQATLCSPDTVCTVTASTGPGMSLLALGWANFPQPITWADSSLWKGPANDTIIAAQSPVEMHPYDPQGRHVGRNAPGGIDLGSPGPRQRILGDIP